MRLYMTNAEYAPRAAVCHGNGESYQPHDISVGRSEPRKGDFMSATKVKVRYGKEVVEYSDAELSRMTTQQLKQLKSDLQANIEMISAKRMMYRNTNTEEKNSPVYWEAMARYKGALAMLRRAITHVNSFMAGAPKPEESQDIEHWLYNYYQQSKTLLSPETVERIKDLASEKAGFYIEIGGE